MSNETLNSQENEKVEDATVETPAEAQEPAASDAEQTQNAENVETTETETNGDGQAETEKTDETEHQAETDGVADNAEVAVVQEKAQKQERVKREKPVKSPKQKGNGMSKTFKLVYFPVMALLVVVMLVFSIVDAVCGYKPSVDKAYLEGVNSLIDSLAADSRPDLAASGTASAADRIFEALDNGGFTAVDEVKDGDDDNSDAEKVTTVTGFASVGNSPAPTVTRMTALPSGTLMSSKDAPMYVGAELTNIIAAIPSQKTVENASGANSSAVIITVRYDSRSDTFGAGDNAAFAANAVQTLIDYAQRFAEDKRLDNDLVVVFTEDIDYSYGAYAFFDAFKGLDDVVSRAKYGLNLDSFGNAGTLAITDASGAGHDYLSAVARTSGSAFNSSIVSDSIQNNFKRSGAVDAFGDIPVIQIAVLGGLDDAQSNYDSAENLSEAIVRQQAALIKNYIEKFAYTDKEYGAEGGAAAFFSYFDWGTVSYNSVASYVIGAIIIALVGAAIAVIAVKKQFSIKKLFVAFGVELLVLASTLAVTVAAYFLIALLLTAFGVIPLHAIIQVRYFNAGILIAAMFISLASVFGFTTLYKKLFRVTSSDTVRGTALVFAFVGAIMSFATPAYSYLTSLLGLLMSAVLLVTACLNGKLKERFGFGFDRLFVYVIPVIICLPFVMSAVTVITELMPMWLLPFTMLLFAAMLGTAVPYLDRTAPIFDKLAKKLPPRTLRVERIETQMIEDKAKKKKFVEQQVKVIEKKKIPVSYKNYFGVCTLAVMGVIVALFSGGFGASFGKTITTPYTYEDAIYNNALVYEWEKNGSTVTQKLVVDDLIAYKFLRYAVDDLEWTGTRYEKTVRYGSDAVVNISPTVTRDGNVYTVSTFDGPRSTVTLTIPNASAITKITVTNAHGDDYEYEFDGNDTIVLRTPYGFGNSFKFTVEGGTPTSISYEEHRVVDTSSSDALSNVDEWNNIFMVYDDSVTDLLSGGIVLKMTVSL